LYLRTHVQLSPDHAYKLSHFWGLNEKERDYFLGLIAYSRAASKEYKSHLLEQLKKIRDENENLSKRYQQSAITNSDNQWAYYSRWHLEAIHMALTIPEFQDEFSLSKRLNLSHSIVIQSLQVLSQLGLVEKQGEKWKPLQNNIHLSKDSPASGLNHLIWRNKAIENFYENRPADLHYTALHTLSRDDVARLKQLILKTLDEMRGIVGPSSEEELVCFSCDFFKV
jgi:uncharacterized protein (TIGR02147 family)